MTAFYKVVVGGFIIGFGTNGNNNTESITKEEYDIIVSVFNAKPSPPEGYDYLILNETKEWVLVESQESSEIDDSEAFAILMGDSK